jgi:hypothetical protein
MSEIKHIPAKQFLNEHPTFFSKAKQLNKFGAKRTTVDKISFHSASEGDLYSELKLQERAGLIQSVETQVKEELCAYGEPICNYYVDFLVFHNDGTREFIEHKGKSTPDWVLKWKMLTAKYKDDKTVKCSINWYKSKNEFKSKFQYKPKF